MAQFTPLSSSVYQVSLWLVYGIVLATSLVTLRGSAACQASLGMLFQLLGWTLDMGLMPLEIVLVLDILENSALRDIMLSCHFDD